MRVNRVITSTRVLRYISLVATLLTVVSDPMSATDKRRLKPPDDSQLVILGVVIGQDDLGTLQEKLGPSQRCHTKEHVSIVGYTVGNVDLVFEFSEVGGGDVTGFHLSHGLHVPNCSFSTLQAKALIPATAGGTHLGMEEIAFLRAFGPPHTKNRRGEWNYHWTWKEQLTEVEKKKAEKATPGSLPSNEAIASIDVTARFSNGVLQYFYISKLEVT